MNDVIEATPAQPLVALGTLQADTPKALVGGAVGIANELAKVIRDKKLAVNIQGREYVRVDGWNLLGALLGVIAREESVIEREDGGFLATVALIRMKDDVVISRASAECGMDEPTWAGRPKYARRSMALTRAQGKAARLAFSWIMVLAGYQPTPAEEMPQGAATAEGIPVGTDYVQTGKHRGKKWEEISNDYLQAIVHGDRSGAEFKALCQAEIDRRAKAAFGLDDPHSIGTDADIPV